MQLTKRRALLALLAACGPSWSAAVGPALDRPALPVRTPSHASLLGAALAGSRWVAVGERGLVVVSDDSGRTWRQASVPVSVTLTAVAFADRARGFATGHGGTVLGTTDGGLTWTRLLDGRGIALLMQQDAIRSADAAQRKAADRMVTDGPDKPLLDLVVSSPSDALVVGAYGMALSTGDGGKTWVSRGYSLDNPKNLHLYSIRRRDQVIAIAGEQGLFFRSENGGRSFQRLAVPYPGSFFTLELPSSREIVLAGMRGNVWRSTDAGGTWEQVAFSSPTAITASTLGPGGGVFLATQSGQVFAGAAPSLQPLKTGVLPPLTGLLRIQGDGLLALSVEGVHLLSETAPSKNAN